MNWEKLYEMQRELDQYISKNNDLHENVDLFEQKYLALLVELGELANETRCFKFWSQKQRSDEEVILEEYVDGIHFLLSLGLDKHLFYESYDVKKSSKSETEQFNLVFNACQLFKENPIQSTYNQLFDTYIQLGQLLGFNEEKIQSAYIQKNETNFERQNQGY